MKVKRCLLVLATAIATSIFLPGYLPDTAFAGDTVYIVQRDWHANILVKKERLDGLLWRSIPEIDDARFVKVSWGDQHFYQSYSSSVWLAARAVLWPTQAVIRIMDYSKPFPPVYTDSGMIAIAMQAGDYDRLCNFISSSFARDKQNNVIPSSGFDYSIGFYRARRKYHLFRTCNTWVALALKKAGLDICPFGVLSVDQLFRRLKNWSGAVSPEKTAQ